MAHAQRDLVEFNLTENVLRSVQLYYTPMLVYFGSLGNCLSMTVFFGTKLCQNSSSIYLGALAISDTGFLVSVFVVWLNLVEVGLFNQPGFCQFFIYLTTLCSFMSVWLVVAFTIERFIAVQYPLYRQSMCTVARAKAAVFMLTTLGVFLCSPVLWFSAPRPQYGKNGNVTECHLAEGFESWAIVYNVIDTVLTFAIPFTVIIILNVLIARAIYRHIKIRKSLTNEPHILKEKQPHAQSFRNNLAQTKITKMLLVVSSAFLCFNLPAYVLRIYAFLHFQNESNLTQTRTLELAQQVSNLLFNTNFGINFILYCATGQNFRTAIRCMFLKRFRRKNATQVATHGMQNVPNFVRPSTTATVQRHGSAFTQQWEDFHELHVIPE
ncbi:C-C chemokine receptor type 1-like [Megachile rotundata]|uniref:C-C chemokine receptor type 1-like n=1 Tax=Megachile rotundata TaxID=143995 RepID=UPI0006151EED|nr:PREDICTED: neuropeptides capa receptor-like [Megachile rotundata]XP_012138541.1 PREDICTED: neuropeptides capa receptor-like [Megachile rotundata]XP_012138542.1 PREDICTED: neuropeptides capa receptor-like [Megachile rotundata]